MRTTIIIFIFLFKFPGLYSSQIITPFISYGVIASDAQIGVELEGENKTAFASMFKVRSYSKEYKGISFESSLKWYFKQGESYNSGWYLMGKAGYNLVKSLSEQDFNIEFSNTYTDFYNNYTLYYSTPLFNPLSESAKYFAPLAGLSLGKKFVFFNDKFSFDISLGYIYCLTPKFKTYYPPGDQNSYSRAVYRNIWKNSIGFPVDFQWSIGYRFD